jgi:nucleotide-binding universal stress UspA family protein
MFERILIPLDGSAMAESALAYAELLPGHQVRLLQIEPATRGPLPGHESAWADWRARREADCMTYLDRAGERLRQQGRIVESSVAFGDPAECIIASAADVDFIVMTTHGRGPGERVIFGSVADRVARHASVPTLLIRTLQRPSAPPRVTRVFVPLDGSTPADAALPVAAAVARDLGVPIHLARVFEPADPGAILRAGPAVSKAHAEDFRKAQRQGEADLDREVRRLRNKDLMASRETRIGSPAETLLDAITPTDLVVMTTHGQGGLRRWLFGSVADKLVREAAAPVLLVHPAACGGRAPQ